MDNNIITNSKEFNTQQLLRQQQGLPPLLCDCNQCESGNTWECDICRREMPWCLGADCDDYPETCDECWAKITGVGTGLN